MLSLVVQFNICLVFLPFQCFCVYLLIGFRSSCGNQSNRGSVCLLQLQIPWMAGMFTCYCVSEFSGWTCKIHMYFIEGMMKRLDAFIFNFTSSKIFPFEDLQKEVSETDICSTILGYILCIKSCRILYICIMESSISKIVIQKEVWISFLAIALPFWSIVISIARQKAS